MSEQHYDVLIIGAGLSGIGAGYHLQTLCPGKSFAILEGRSAIGGTWDLFRYPGIRSDSDMYTLGYAFKPWREGQAIADGAAILNYVKTTARENNLEQKIHYNHRATRYSWSSRNALWTVETDNTATGATERFTCHFLLNCSGYYRYDEGYTPEFKGRELEADIIVTATGLNLIALGGAELRVDGEKRALPDMMSYKGTMLSGVPNLALVVGYTNASWTLKADLTDEYVCRLLNFMDQQGYDYCTPKADPTVKNAPFLDLNSGYVQRALEHLPKQGDRAPWKLYQNYLLDLLKLRYGSVTDRVMNFSRVADSPKAVEDSAT